MNWRRAFLGISIFCMAYAGWVLTWAYEAWVESSLTWRHLFEAKFGDVLFIGIYAACSIVAILLGVWVFVIATGEEDETK